MTPANIRDLIERLEWPEMWESSKADKYISEIDGTPFEAAAALRQLLDAAANHEIALAEAAAKARAEAFERCAKYADTAFLVPPDGGSASEEETDICDKIATAIRAMAKEGK